MQPKNPAPLLIVIASYDANGNGKNDYDPNHPELLNDKSSPIFGEQWALTKPEDCYETFFGENSYSLMNYYKEMTHGKFWFYPVHMYILTWELSLKPELLSPAPAIFSASVPYLLLCFCQSTYAPDCSFR